ncbi:MAG: hypothetical protein IT249_18665 [Chitinophagaceae bacterium]|nr:hypothetical protein [Chitinophagaceae bacterium]
MTRLKNILVDLSLGIIILFSNCRQKDDTFNLGFEKVNTNQYPIGWNLHGEIKIDSFFSVEGKYSLRLYRSSESPDFSTCTKTINAPLKGKTLKLKGYLRTEDVKNGFAGLWIRVEDKNGDILAFDNMYNKGVVGFHGWNNYNVEVQFDELKAARIFFGALLVGSGSVWVDNLKLYVDDIQIQKAELKKTDSSSIDYKGSGINEIHFTKERIGFLTDLAMIWGFLKYHHPTVIQGNYDWDEELFKAISKTASDNSVDNFNNAIEAWIDSLPPVKQCNDAPDITTLDIKFKPLYGYIFNHHLPKSIENKLLAILDAYKGCYNDQHYVGITPNIGNPIFKNENRFINNYHPDAGVRILALFRYWNMIQYFYPYRHLVDNWEKILPEFIPKFIAASNRQQYILTCLELASRIKDGHAFMKDNLNTLDSIKGLQITPFQAKFIEDRLVVTGFYDSSEKVRNNLKPGDIIKAIDGVDIDTLIKRYIKYTPGSNFEYQLASMASSNGFLLRSSKKFITLKVEDRKKIHEILIENIPFSSANIIIDSRNMNITKGFEKIDDNIGYIYPALLKEKDIDSVRVLFKDTKGLIFDFRCYPSTFMPFVYGSWLKSESSNFVRFALPSIQIPGAVLNGAPIANGGQQATNSSFYSEGFSKDLHATYKGKVIFLVNASTISQSEYTVMALSTIPNAVVLGSKSAGADGNVSQIMLPGGLQTFISGLGVYYPDGEETQGAGVKIDVFCYPTIKGIREGKDELMDKAIYLIKNDKAK